MNSIAIPTIGSIGTGLYAKDVAKEMIQIALTYAQQKRMNLKNIHFIIYPTDTLSYFAFQRELIDSAGDLQTQKQLADSLIKSSSSQELLQKSECRLLFKAQCTTTKIPVEIHVYHGTINNTENDAIIDITALCSKHSITNKYEDIAKYDDTKHSTKTLRHLQLSNNSIYQVCPYGCLAGFNDILACISANGENSVVIPLLNIDINAENMEYLVDLIESFMDINLCNDASLSCFKFIIGYRNRSTEIATWTQDKIMNKALKFKWKIIQKISVQNFGMNVYYVASDKTAILNMKRSIKTNCNTWACHRLNDDVYEYVYTIPSNLFHQLALEIWSVYNTIVIRQDKPTGVCIFGFEADIMDTVSYMFKLSKVHVEEKACQEVQQLTAETTEWYAAVGLNRIKFETKINYELEKNYKIYYKNKTKKIFRIDSDTKIVDFENMKITDVVHGVQCQIKKSTLRGT